MRDILVVAEVGRGKIRGTTRSAVTAGHEAQRLLGGRLSILVLGQGIARVARELAGYGADRVLSCDHPELAQNVAEYWVPTVASAAPEAGLMLSTASSFGKDLLPRVAARLGAAYVGDCSALLMESGCLLFERPLYAGNVLGYCALTTPLQVATIRQTEFPPAEVVTNRTPSPIENLPFVPPREAARRVHFVSFDEVSTERPELTEARVVVAGGRPLKESFFAILNPLADELAAALGATRAACDGGYAPDDYQVGQTGKVVAPELYVAVGISGALQHVAGMRKSRVVIAINRDAEAPIFQVADYGWVADLFEATPALVEALRRWKGRR